MNKQAFILENINILCEFRDIEEIKNYFKENNFDMKYEEIKNLKTSLRMMLSRASDSQVLKVRDLANVSGGLSEEEATGISVAIGAGFALALIGSRVGFAAYRAPTTAVTVEVENGARMTTSLSRTEAAGAALKANGLNALMMGSFGMQVGNTFVMPLAYREETEAQQNSYGNQVAEQEIKGNPNG